MSLRRWISLSDASCVGLINKTLFSKATRCLTTVSIFFFFFFSCYSSESDSFIELAIVLSVLFDCGKTDVLLLDCF